MKWSKYNSIIDNGDGNYIAYNSASDNLIVLVRELKEILEKNLDRVEDLRNIHPDFYQHLCEKKFITEDETDEAAEYIKKLRAEDDSDEVFGLTINPTMDCNLKCWYCYENHIAGSRMTEEVMDSVKKFIGRKLANGKIKTFNLSFFGGEPLLEFHNIILPIIDFANETAKENDVKMGVAFTTNGVLLTKKVVDRLLEYGIDVHFQIAFDGGRDMHDRTKKFPNGKGSYDIVLKNTKYALDKGLSVAVRCNYTGDNVKSFDGLLADFNDYEKYRDKLRFSFQTVWQDDKREGTADTVIKLTEKVSRMCLDYDSKPVSRSRCYADKENCAVINYNGDVFKCTARDFKSEMREGVLNPDGSITYNERYYDRMQIKYSNKSCVKCRILPICKLCTQQFLESFELDKCLLGVDEEREDLMIRDKILAVYAQKR